MLERRQDFKHEWVSGSQNTEEIYTKLKLGIGYLTSIEKSQDYL
jgi:hypothetical protein